MEINLWYIVYSEKANQMIFFPKIYGLVSKEQGVFLMMSFQSHY